MKLPDRACAVLYLQQERWFTWSILSAVSKIKPCLCNVYVSETANDLLKLAIFYLIVSATRISTGVILELIRATSSSSTIRFFIYMFVRGLEHALRGTE